MAGSGFGVRDVRIRGFRSARSVHFAPGAICALLGGPSVGKSNVLEATWILLEQGARAPAAEDLSAGSSGPISLSATLEDGDEIALETSPGSARRASGRVLGALFLPAALRSGALVEGTPALSAARAAAQQFAVGEGGGSSAAPAAALVAGLEQLCVMRERGLVLLIEEPELFLRPQAQRYLYRLLRRFAELGNQVLYSTHEPSFVNVGRLEELALVERSPTEGTRVFQPGPLGAEESFRALSEIDAERGELFLASAALLVEGRTEKLTFPFVFSALGHDVDREAVTIVDCGGKANKRLFIRICHAARVPCVAVHDRDAPPERRPSRAQSVLNSEIAQLAGADRTIVLAPDFEAIAGLRGHRHKPTRAWQRFAHVAPAGVPHQLREAVEKVIALARA